MHMNGPIISVFWTILAAGCYGSKLPNIVIILADDLGYGDVGCFGNDTIRTPNIDRIGQEGAIFTQALAAEAVCTPSRSALLTGRYPMRAGMTHPSTHVLAFVAQSGGLPTSEVTFAKLLQQKGYATGLVGKWHLGMSCSRVDDFCHHPTNHGFDFFYGLPHTNLKDFGDKPTDGSVITVYNSQLFTILYSSAAVGLLTAIFLKRKGYTWGCILISFLLLGVLYVLFALSNLKLLNSMLIRNTEVVEQPIRLTGLAQRFAQESKDFMQEKVQEGKPFLLFLAFSHVHTALATTADFNGQSKHGRYGDNLEEMDWAIGQVLEAIDKFGVAQDTFVFFTSDHGGHLEETGLDGVQEGGYNGRLKGGKAMGGMEGGIRVPTVARLPGRIRPGSVIDAPVSLMDLFPTLLHMADIPLPQDRVIDGKDFSPFLDGMARTSQHQFLFHYCGTEIHAARLIESDTHVWKVHFAHLNWLPGEMRCSWLCFCNQRVLLDPPLLYNIQQDPYEEHPIDPHSQNYKKVVSVLRKAVSEHSQSLPKVENQLSLPHNIWLPWLQPCCNFPYCNCKDPKYPVDWV